MSFKLYFWVAYDGEHRTTLYSGQAVFARSKSEAKEKLYHRFYEPDDYKKFMKGSPEYDPDYGIDFDEPPCTIQRWNEEKKEMVKIKMNYGQYEYGWVWWIEEIDIDQTEDIDLYLQAKLKHS